MNTYPVAVIERPVETQAVDLRNIEVVVVDDDPEVLSNSASQQSLEAEPAAAYNR